MNFEKLSGTEFLFDVKWVRKIGSIESNLTIRVSAYTIPQAVEKSRDGLTSDWRFGTIDFRGWAL